MAPMKITIGIVTGRAEPRLDWIMDGIERQAQDGDDLQIVIVDVLGREADQIGFRWARGITQMITTRPKPTIWQGAHRQTSCDWWALSNARNTVLAHATRDYVVFVDDRCALGDHFLATVRVAERARSSVIAGSYDKLCADPASGDATAKRDVDHRRTMKPAGLVNCGGGWLFGCAIAMPLAWALEVNGFEEGCDGLGMEDVIFGLHLHNAGYRIDFVPALYVEQERSPAFTAPTYRKTDKGTSPQDKSHAALARFGKRRRTEFTPDLHALREIAQRGQLASLPLPSEPARDWYDQQLLAEMS